MVRAVYLIFVNELRMSDQSINTAPFWRTPLLCTIAFVMVLAMLRLGLWQLDRAQYKREIADQLEARASQTATRLENLIAGSETNNLRFRQVLVRGRYLSNSDIYLDNQVFNGQVGYQVFTPFRIKGTDMIVMIARGWASAGASRDVLPAISTDVEELNLAGRLNNPPAQPPLWNDKYAVSNGAVWQYLPISELETVFKGQIFPLVVELAPNAIDSLELLRKWPNIDDQWVAKHQGYAFQWFAMAAAFFIACLVLLVKSSRKN